MTPAMTDAVQHLASVDPAAILPFGEVNVGPTERLATGGLGGLLLFVGLRREGGLGLAMAVAGGVLALRATTGHCPAYAALRGRHPTRAADPARRDRSTAAPLQSYGGRRWKGHRWADEQAEVLGGPHPDEAAGPSRQAAWARAGGPVDLASDLSFPASDPPAYSAGRA